VAATRSVSCATMRCAAFLAFSVVSPQSITTSFSLATAERLDAALRIDVGDPPSSRAHAHHLPGSRVDARERHDQADLDFGGLLRTRPPSIVPFAAAPESTPRRVREVLVVVLWLICIPSFFV